MDQEHLFALPDSIHLAQNKLASFKKSLLAAKGEYDRIRAEVYKREFKPKQHFLTAALVTADPEVVKARSEVEKWRIQYFLAKANVERVQDTFHAALTSMQKQRLGGKRRRSRSDRRAA